MFFVIVLFMAYMTQLFALDVLEIDCKSLSWDQLKNEEYAYRCRENDNMIYHISQLSRAQKFKKFLPSRLRQKFQRNEWIEISVSAYKEIKDKHGIPYSGCLTAAEGDGGIVKGTIGDSYGISLGVGVTFPLAHAIIAGQTLGPSLSFGLGTSTSTDYECIVQPGLTVQVVFMPLYYMFEKAEYRLLSVLDYKIFKSLSFGEWQVAPKIKALSSSKIVKCVTDPQLLRCGNSNVLSAALTEQNSMINVAGWA